MAEGGKGPDRTLAAWACDDCDREPIECPSVTCGAYEVYVTGAIPPGEITEATEMVFVAGRAFVNAAKHEQVVGQIAAERDTLVVLLPERDRARRQRDELLHAARAVNNQGGGVDALLDVAERIRAEH